MRKSVYYTNDKLVIIDQTRLPSEDVERELKTLADVIEAIKKLRVRGAPAIGIAAAYGVLVGLKSTSLTFDEIKTQLAESRPTAVNLFWALERMNATYQANKDKVTLFEALRNEAIAIHIDDAKKCQSMGEKMNSLIPESAQIMTICNTGFLATGGIGTAFGGLSTAHAAGKNIHVFACETRPLLQGARLTSWELMQQGIPATLISDNMAAHVMKTKKIDLIVAGADRIALNGDSANKIGTYGLALLAAAHNIPFYIVAPTSTVDQNCKTGESIVIEERDSNELRRMGNIDIAPQGINCYNPAFDVTPSHLITAIVTEEKIYYQDKDKKIRV